MTFIGSFQHGSHRILCGVACAGRQCIEYAVDEDRAECSPAITLRHGFYLVYDNDLGDPIADGFYFTIGYPGMTSGELAKELMYYGVSAISLVTTGSHQEGLRACTSFIKDHQYAQLDERMKLFANAP